MYSNKLEVPQKKCQFTKIKEEKPNNFERSVTLLIPQTKNKSWFHCQEEKNIEKSQGLKNPKEEKTLFQPKVRYSYETVKKQKDRPSTKKKTIKRLKTLQYDHIERSDEVLKQSLTQIKRIIKTLIKFRDFGFSESKVNEWMNKFLWKKKKLLSTMFLGDYMGRKTTQNYHYEYENHYEKIRILLIKIFINMKQEKENSKYDEISSLPTDLRQFRLYLEDILMNKHLAKLNELKKTMTAKYASINAEDWQSVKEYIEPKLSLSAEISHFMQDMKRIQYRYGQFNHISKYNRINFESIIQAENYIKNSYKQLNCA